MESAAPKAIVYLRVSTDEQATSGLGLEAQQAACLAWAAREGRAVASIHQDDITGAATLDKRPGLAGAVLALEPGDVLLVAKRDRIGRGDPVLIAMIEAAVARKKCRVVSAAGEGTDGDDPASILMRRLIDAFAEYERLIIKARTKAALDAKRRRGERIGQVPIGRRLLADGAMLEDDLAEIALIAEVHQLHGLGLSLRAIAREITARGTRPKNGGAAWSHSTIAEILARPLPCTA